MPSFCRFTVGTSGASAANLRYISRRDAVKERERGTFFRNLPDGVDWASTYGELRANLEAFAWAREESEKGRLRGKGSSGQSRTHYRCVLSFENETKTPIIERLVDEWLREAMPAAVVCSFVHRNTEHVHVHCWIDARGTDGRKLDFSSRQWKQLGAKWDRIYSRHMEREAVLEERFKVQGGGAETRGGNERGTVRTSSRTDNGARKSSAATARLSPKEPEIEACTQSRNRAFRATRDLCRKLERMGRRERSALPEIDRGR
jgi:hypothetical protein